VRNWSPGPAYVLDPLGLFFGSTIILVSQYPREPVANPAPGTLGDKVWGPPVAVACAPGTAGDQPFAIELVLGIKSREHVNKWNYCCKTFDMVSGFL
jgi:hypothetical protein